MSNIFRRGTKRPEHLARTVEAVEHVTGMRPREGDVDIGAALCDGLAFDDRHVEDRSFVLAVPAIAHAMEAGGVHLLAPTQEQVARHAAWLRPVAERLGLRVGLLVPGDGHDARRRCHEAEIVCGVAPEFVFDLLRNSLAWDDKKRVAMKPRVAVVDHLDTILLDQYGQGPTIGMPMPVEHEWHHWADSVASDLDRGDHVELHRDEAVLTPMGIDHLLERFDLSEALAAHVQVFDLVTSAVLAHDRCRRGRDYDVRDGEVVDADELPRRVRDAIAVREGLPLTSAHTILAATTTRGHLLRYDLVTGIGVIAGSAARNLRELYGLRSRAPRTDAPAGEDVVFDDDESRMRAVLAAMGGRPVLRAANDALAAAVSEAVGAPVLRHDDPVPANTRLLIGIGRGGSPRADVRTARMAEETRFYVTKAELASMGGPAATRKLHGLRTGASHPKTTALIAKLQENDELVGFYSVELDRVAADVRDTHHERLRAHRRELASVEGFRRLLRETLDRLTGDLDYTDLLSYLGVLYPCALPEDQPGDLAAAVRADADRALSERIDEIEAAGGEGATAAMLERVTRVHEGKMWREHIVDLDILRTAARGCRPQHQPAEFTRDATELFAELLTEFDEETIAFVFNLPLRD